MKVVCFDLDDTLYKEIDFLKSAFREIAEYALKSSGRHDVGLVDLYDGMLNVYFSNGDALGFLIASVGVDLAKATLLNLYRNHFPQISLSEGALELLTEIKSQGFEIGIITDGRSVQQRNKIKALGLDKIIPERNIVISEEFGSEKPTRANYECFVAKYSDATEFCYIADNIKKDFLAPNAMGWKTICLKDDGRNIHSQSLDLPQEHLPRFIVDHLSEVVECLLCD